MTIAKAVNYTPEQVEAITQQYAEGVTVEAIASGIGKSVRSVTMKLSSLGVYQKKAYVSKTGAVPTSKEQMVAQIANIMGVPADSLPGLEKSNKTTLDVLLKFCAAV